MYNADKSRIYFYYIDQLNGYPLGHPSALRTLRRAMPDLTSVNWWQGADVVFQQRWSLPALSDATALPPVQGGYCLSNTQPGFLKNKWGQLPGDFRIYVPTDCQNGPYGGQIRSLRVNCHL